MKTLLLSIACCIAIAGCSGNVANTNSTSNTSAVPVANSPASNSGPTSAYPQSTADAFLNSCQKAGSDLTFCSCVFAKVQAKYTFEEFSVIESKLVAGDPPKEFVEFTGKARAECTKK